MRRCPHPRFFPTRPARPITSWTRRFLIALTILAWFGIAAMVIFGLRLIGSVLVLYSIAALLAFVLYPLVKSLGRVIGRRLAALLVMLLSLLARRRSDSTFSAPRSSNRCGVLADRLAFLTQPDALQQIPLAGACAGAFWRQPGRCEIPFTDWLGQAGGWLRSHRLASERGGLCAHQHRRCVYHHDLSAHGWKTPAPMATRLDADGVSPQHRLPA